MCVDSQAVDNGATLPALPLPVVNLSQKAEEGLLGVGHIAVWRPAQELEVTHNKLAFLKLQKVKREKKKMFLELSINAPLPAVIFLPCFSSIQVNLYHYA